MKKIISLIFCLLIGHSFTQEINFDWNTIFGYSGETSGLSIVCDSAGFIFASGEFEGEININGTSLTSSGGKDGYLFKLDSLGNLLWSKQFSSQKNVRIYSLAIDQNNDLLLLGDYKVNVDFDTVITTNNEDTLFSSNMLIAKYNGNGDLLWVENTGGVNYQGNALTIDANNDVLITGKSIDISLYNAGIPIRTLDSVEVVYPSGTYWDYFHPVVSYIAKFSTNGNLLWIEESGGEPQEIITDNSNNIIVTGSFLDDTYFDGILVPKIGFETSFLAQYSPNGSLNWIKTSGGSANWNSGYGLEVDSLNNIYQSGQVFGNNIEFDGNVVLPFGGTDAFLSKYDMNGNLIWYKMIGTPTTMNGQHNFNRGSALKIDANGDLFMLGYFSDDLTFGPTHIQSEGALDMMLLKYNSNGFAISASQYSDYGWVEGMGLDINSENDIYFTGYTTLDSWNSSFPSFGFIAKVNSSIPTSPLNVPKETAFKNIKVYPNPSSGKVFLDFLDNKQAKHVEVFSLDGRKILSLNTSNSEMSFELEQNGVFLIKLSVMDEVFMKKIVIH